MMCNTPILIIFFNRPNQLKQVFESVKKAKPRTLFLAQDGPRYLKHDDIRLVNECRKIVEDIDWDCNVYKSYSDINLTCDHREFTAISWAFSMVDRLIILEDDCVPVASFYQFCDELLEKYCNDLRIHSISGFNRLGVYEHEKNDYIFSQASCGWGWATWKRVWNDVEYINNNNIFEDKDFFDIDIKSKDDSIDLVYGDFKSKYIKNWRACKHDKIVKSWELPQGLALILNNMLTITPTRNMIKYIGFSENALHAPISLFLTTRKIAKMCSSRSYDLHFPIKHPKFMFRNVDFELKSNRAYVGNKYLDKFEIIIRYIIYNIFLKHYDKK